MNADLSSWRRRGAATARHCLPPSCRRARYVAFVSSRRKAASLKASLANDGVPPDRLAALRAPAGLAIGAITPEEIALSVLAEIVQVRRQPVRATAAALGD